MNSSIQVSPSVVPSDRILRIAREAGENVVAHTVTKYRILQVELERAGIARPGPRALGLTELSRPNIDWVSLATGLGIPGTRAETADTFATALQRALSEPGPALIEAIL